MLESRDHRAFSRHTKTGPPLSEDWIPDMRALDPQMHKTTGPSIPQTRTSWIKDFVGSRTSSDSGLRGIQDFVGPRTSWDLGLRRKQDIFTHWIGILFCRVLYENTNFQDKFYNMDTTWFKVSR